MWVLGEPEEKLTGRSLAVKIKEDDLSFPPVVFAKGCNQFGSALRLQGCFYFFKFYCIFSITIYPPYTLFHLYLPLTLLQSPHCCPRPSWKIPKAKVDLRIPWGAFLKDQCVAPPKSPTELGGGEVLAAASFKSSPGAAVFS